MKLNKLIKILNSSIKIIIKDFNNNFKIIYYDYVKYLKKDEYIKKYNIKYIYQDETKQINIIVEGE